VVSHRRHLKRTEIITGRATNVSHTNKKVTIEVPGLAPFDREYDHVVVTAGAVSRTFPIPGVAEVAIGMKTI
jgi:NADH dehydrogenase